MPLKSHPRRASSSRAIPTSKGRLGLHKLWPDEDSLSQFNLVLVHGFAGDALDTWTHANGKCWPKDFPPKDGENLKAASVYVWGYRAVDSGVRDGLTAVPQSIYSIGETLCSDLHDNEIYALDVSRNRHSLYGKIFDETKHVIFLDTPHHGVPRDVLQSIYGRRVKRDVWSKYELWSEVLGDLSKKFSEMDANFAVSSSSASLLKNEGDPEAQVAPGQTGFIHAKRERSFHMDHVDHSSMCKFASLDDINYKRLAARIRIGQLAIEKRNPLFLTLRSWISGQDGDENSDENQREHEDNSSRRHKETCKWLFQDGSFHRWIARNNAISVLLVTGPSGVGKTMLTSAAIDYVSDLPGCPTVGYIFLRFDIRLLHRDLLRMIASSLLDRAVDCNVVPDKAFDYPTYNKAESSKLKEFIQLLLQALAHMGHIYFFIDGLNEVPSSLESTKPDNRKKAEKELGDIRNVIDFLFECASAQENLRLWFSSQADDMTLEWMEKRSYTEIKIPEEDSTRDVQLYLNWAIEEKLKDRISSQLLRLFAEITVLVKAENNFRWAATMIEEISKCSNEDDVIETLKVGLPWRVSDVYAQTLRRLRNNDIEDQRLPGGRTRSIGLSKAILSILTFAKRPLSLRALQEAISAYSLQERNTGCLNISSSSINDERSLVNRCVPFVKYVPSKDGNGVFRLDHESVLKFLLDHASDSQTVATDRMVDPKILAKACLNYLFQQRYNKLLKKYTAFEFRTDRGSDIRDHHLVQYAAKYWYRHLEETTKSEELSQCAVAFVKSPQFITAIQIQSLFVPGHFIQDLDCDDRKKRCIKKNLPGWLEEHHAGEKVFKDYHIFLAEWGAFLQRGIADKVNGELDRCLWSALGPTNYFNRYSSSLQRYPAYLLQLEETGLNNIEGFYVAAASYEQMRTAVWKVANSRFV
ncbi:unnamed protein product [Clonostachys rosea]|uniref:Nephrocystin 3-like N-terminal domain-containing protein n=1 Tax=Bionectria ochroleuca TaxID=29856 RepID=A0ABY6UF98_BIOOC|nr:unnamed protein product [Clonostachys rosea]